MLVSKYNNFILFKTPFSERYDLIQKFRGVDESAYAYNGPIDFMESGLMQKDKCDYWHIDIPFSISNDEATPCIINGKYIGANHGFEFVATIYLPQHGKDVRDIGSVWQDEKGVRFTLLDVEEEHLKFLSENVGESETDYAFAMINGSLSFVANGENTSMIPMAQKQFFSTFSRSIRPKKKRFVAYKDGQSFSIYGSMECDYAEIQEEYEIINPATIAKDLQTARPQGGFKRKPDLTEFGKAMLNYRMTYQIWSDGSVLCSFEAEKLSNVRFEQFMGAMYQEKLDVYGGGIWRYLPKTKPFQTKEGTFDFSKQVLLASKIFPQRYLLGEKDWTDVLSPPERVVDYFKDQNGTDRLAFACGYLPIYDGVPAKRRKSLSKSMSIVSTRKAYPIFMDGDLSSVKGVAYKKYFIPQESGASVYTVPFKNKTYIYMDFFKEHTLKISVKGSVTLLEKSENVSYEVKDTELVATAKTGYAAFLLEE